MQTYLVQHNRANIIPFSGNQVRHLELSLENNKQSAKTIFTSKSSDSVDFHMNRQFVLCKENTCISVFTIFCIKCLADSNLYGQAMLSYDILCRY